MRTRPLRPMWKSGLSAVALLSLVAGTAGVAASIDPPQAMAASDGLHATGSQAAGSTTGATRAGSDATASTSDGDQSGHSRTTSQSMSRSIDTPHMSKSLSISHSMGLSVEAADGATVGHAMTKAQAKVIDTPGQTTVDAGSTSRAKLNGSPAADGNVSVASESGAEAAIGDLSASASSSSGAELAGRSAQVGVSIDK
ncbi:MAG: hypothetical protein QOK29_1555 [Rhodospirillaceae bacterium]|nr:hypothetical protein [Rhodospirillaceae bacterium]